MSQYTTDPGDELDIHKIESAVKLYYGYTGAYTRHLLKEWHAETIRQAKEAAWDEAESQDHLQGDWSDKLKMTCYDDHNPYRSKS